MDSSDRDDSEEIVPYGKVTVVKDFIHQSGKECVDTSSERLLDKGKGISSKGKDKVHDMLPSSTLNAKRPFPSLIAGEFCQDNALQRIMETEHSEHSALSVGPIPDQCNEPEDISTESGKALEDDNRRDNIDITRDFMQMVKGNDMPSSNDCNADVLALKENQVDEGENLNQEMLNDLGLGKPCSCSLCLKAAHMWTDLTFQDTRGRLTELQKSKRRATDQIAKFTKHFSKVSKSTKLEFDLMQHWKMLFLHTQDALVHEIAQAQSDLEARGKLMDNCKKELELIGNVLPD